MGSAEKSGAKGGPRGLQLHLKLVLAGSVTTFAGIALVSAHLVYQQKQVMTAEVHRSTEALRSGFIERNRLLAGHLAATLATSDRRDVDEAIHGTRKRNSDMAYGYFADAEGEIVEHTDRAAIGRAATVPPGMKILEKSDETGRKIVEIYQPVGRHGERIGTLMLAFDLKTIDSRASQAMLRADRINAKATWSAIATAFIVTLLGIIGSILLSRRLLRPVRQLADDAAAIARGNLDREIRASETDDEIGFLARQFEAMRRSVKTNIGELVVAKQKAEAATRVEKRLRAQIEEHSRLLEIKVDERTRELREINSRLTEYDHMKSEFLSNVSHELRSPLAAVSSAAKIINRYGDENPRTGKKFSSVIMDESARLGRLINDLLDLAKIEAGRVEWNHKRIDNPMVLVEHVVSTFRPLAEERDISLTLEAPNRLPTITLDSDRIIQVMTNLCSNALKFTSEKGAIHIAAGETIHRGQHVIEISVSDNGPGIPTEEQEKVFDRFHQVKVKRDGNKPPGTGLGLAICREVVNHHGGEIWCEPIDPNGCRMVFSLPVDQPTSALSFPTGVTAAT